MYPKSLWRTRLAFWAETKWFVRPRNRILWGHILEASASEACFHCRFRRLIVLPVQCMSSGPAAPSAAGSTSCKTKQSSEGSRAKCWRSAGPLHRKEPCSHSPTEGPASRVLLNFLNQKELVSPPYFKHMFLEKWSLNINKNKEK